MTVIQLSHYRMRPLPSSDSARDLVNGVPGALPRAAAHAGARAGLLLVGMLIAGLRGKQAVAAAAAGSLVIEAFALTWFQTQKPCGVCGSWARINEPLNTRHARSCPYHPDKLKEM